MQSDRWLWWWLVGCLVVGCSANLFNIIVVRRRRARPRPMRTTGLALEVEASEGTACGRWVGSGSLSSRLGMLNATWPLMVLDVRPGELDLHLRPPFVAAMFGAQPLHASSTAPAVVFPARGWFNQPHVGISSGGRDGYFRTSRREEMLGTLARAGFTVDPVERKINYV